MGIFSRSFDEYIFRLPQGTLTQLNFDFKISKKGRIKYTETNNNWTINSKIHKPSTLYTKLKIATYTKKIETAKNSYN